MLTPLSDVHRAVADGLTPMVNARGEQVVQLHQRLPLGEWFYLPFEKRFDPESGSGFGSSTWAREFAWVPMVCVVVYLAAIAAGTRWMRHREPFDLRGSLAAWNLLLAVFSFVGAVRTVPDLLYRLLSEPHPLTSTVCTPAHATWGVGGTGLWVMLFILSKIPELVDTFFVVARKRPLIFLHWYHHATVLLYCWHSFATEANQALYFVAMNYSVHAVMYGYYFLMALRLKPKWLPPSLITVAQISQMVVGVFIQGTGMAKFFAGGTEACPLNSSNLFWGGVMYLSYFALFTKFALDRYVFKKRRAAKKAA